MLQFQNDSIDYNIRKFFFNEIEIYINIFNYIMSFTKWRYRYFWKFCYSWQLENFGKNIESLYRWRNEYFLSKPTKKSRYDVTNVLFPQVFDCFFAWKISCMLDNEVTKINRLIQSSKKNSFIFVIACLCRYM